MENLHGTSASEVSEPSFESLEVVEEIVLGEGDIAFEQPHGTGQDPFLDLAGKGPEKNNEGEGSRSAVEASVLPSDDVQSDGSGLQPIIIVDSSSPRSWGSRTEDRNGTSFPFCATMESSRTSQSEGSDGLPLPFFGTMASRSSTGSSCASQSEESDGLPLPFYATMVSGWESTGSSCASQSEESDGLPLPFYATMGSSMGWPTTNQSEERESLPLPFYPTIDSSMGSSGTSQSAEGDGSQAPFFTTRASLTSQSGGNQVAIEESDESSVSFDFLVTIEASNDSPAAGQGEEVNENTPRQNDDCNRPSSAHPVITISRNSSSVSGHPGEGGHLSSPLTLRLVVNIKARRSSFSSSSSSSAGSESHQGDQSSGAPPQPADDVINSPQPVDDVIASPVPSIRIGESVEGEPADNSSPVQCKRFLFVDVPTDSSQVSKREERRPPDSHEKAEKVDHQPLNCNEKQSCSYTDNSQARPSRKRKAEEPGLDIRPKKTPCAGNEEEPRRKPYTRSDARKALREEGKLQKRRNDHNLSANIGHAKRRMSRRR